jgi:hypothetical protein
MFQTGVNICSWIFIFFPGLKNCEKWTSQNNCNISDIEGKLHTWSNFFWRDGVKSRVCNEGERKWYLPLHFMGFLAAASEKVLGYQSKSFLDYRHDFASKIVQKLFFLVYQKSMNIIFDKKAQENIFCNTKITFWKTSAKIGSKLQKLLKIQSRYCSRMIRSATNWPAQRYA